MPKQDNIQYNFRLLNNYVRYYSQDWKGLSFAKQFESDNLYSALQLASDFFNVALNEIEYELIQTTRKRFSLYRRSCIILAYPAVKRSKKLLPKEIMVNNVLDKVFSSIFFVYKIDGIYLQFFHEDGAIPITYDDVLNKLYEKEINYFDREKLKDIVQKYSGSNETVKLVDVRMENHDFDAVVNVMVNSEKTQVLVSIDPPLYGGIDATRDMIFKALDAHGVITGFHYDIIYFLATHPIYKTPVEVAAMVLPVAGQNAEIIYIEDQQHLVSHDNQSVFNNYNHLMTNVSQGDILAIKLPMIPGKQGYLVDGTAIEPELYHDKPLALGKNTQLTKDGLAIIAAIDGIGSKNIDGVIDVQTVITINGDIGPDTGNIDMVGSLIVKGDILDGYSVHIDGDLEVSGVIAKAQVSVEGNIIVHQGIKAGLDQVIEAKGFIRTNFIEYSYVEAKAGIFVNNSVLYSQLRTEGYIFLTGTNSSVLGGNFVAYKGMSLYNVGSFSSERIDLSVGVKPSVLKQIADYNLKIEQTKREINLIRLKGNYTDETKNNSVEDQLTEKNKILEQLGKLLSQQQAYTMPLGVRFTPIISVRGSLESGAQIRIFNDVMKMTRTFRHFSLKYINNKVQHVDYEEVIDDRRD